VSVVDEEFPWIIGVSLLLVAVGGAAARMFVIVGIFIG